MTQAKKTILITGASVGLGLAVAKLARQQGHRGVLTARMESLPRFLQAGIVESENVLIRPLDVMSDQDRKAVVSEVLERWGSIDVLVNNAGFTYRSVLEHVEESELHMQMGTNFWGPMELIRLLLPSMRQRHHGQIINVSSVGGMMAMPTMSIYSASKFALEGASEALYYELKPWNIHVTLVEPGFIKSDSFKAVRYTTQSGLSMRDPGESYYGHYRFMTEFIVRLMGLSTSTPEHIARKILKLIDSHSPPLRLAATPDAYVFDLLRRWLPRKIYHWVLYRLLPFPDCWGDEVRLRARCKLERKRLTPDET